MKDVKIIFVACEIASFLGLFMTLFCADWRTDMEQEFSMKLLTFLCACCAVMFQWLQQDIKNEEEDKV